MTVIYSGDKAERATATTYLEKRIEINRAYSSVDFDAWLFDRLAVESGENILDVGCGSGAQTIPLRIWWDQAGVCLRLISPRTR